MRSLLARADEDARVAARALDPARVPAPAAVGPRTPSKQGCTTMCHVGIEERKVDRAFGYGFSHDAHLVKAKLDCATCHAETPHGTVTVKPKDCASCHHPTDTDTDRCVKCHLDVATLRERTPEGRTSRTMEDLDCATCHEALPKGHRREDVKASCLGCHESDPDAAEKDFDKWIASYEAPLKEVEARLASAPDGPATREVRAELDALRRAGPQHNVPWAKDAAARMLKRLTEASDGR